MIQSLALSVGHCILLGYIRISQTTVKLGNKKQLRTKLSFGVTVAAIASSSPKADVLEKVYEMRVKLGKNPVG